MIKKCSVSPFLLLMLLFSVSCASSTITIKPVQEPDRASLEKRIGKYAIYIGSLDSANFQYTVKHMKEQVLSDQFLSDAEKDKRIKFYESLQWQPNKYYWWTLRYRQQFSRKPGDINLTIVDPKGARAGAPYYYELVKKKESATVTTTRKDSIGKTQSARHYSDEYFDSRFYFMTDFPVIKEMAPVDRVPITVTGVFLDNQKTVHKLEPVQ